MASSGVRAWKWTRNLDTVLVFLDTEFTETEGNWKVQNQAQAIESERHPVSASYSGFPPRTDWQSGGHGFDPRQLHQLILKNFHYCHYAALPRLYTILWQFWPADVPLSPFN